MSILGSKQTKTICPIFNLVCGVFLLDLAVLDFQLLVLSLEKIILDELLVMVPGTHNLRPVKKT